MNLLRSGSQWLEQMRTAHMTSPVEYRTPGSPPDSYTVNATYGKTDYEVTNDYGATIRTHVIDFLIMGEELNLEPKPGDAIVADGQKYEVMNLAGEGCWRWSDPYRTTLRIHTKDIGADV